MSTKGNKYKQKKNLEKLRKFLNDNIQPDRRSTQQDSQRPQANK